jgi:hypothetical protein
MRLEQELPYKITATKHNVHVATEWCKEHIGKKWSVLHSEQDGVWTVFWEGPKNWDYYCWYFKNEKDAMWFALCWT